MDILSVEQAKALGLHDIGFFAYTLETAENFFYARNIYPKSKVAVVSIACGFQLYADDTYELYTKVEKYRKEYQLTCETIESTKIAYENKIEKLEEKCHTIGHLLLSAVKELEEVK